jgi:hypothetical protein
MHASSDLVQELTALKQAERFNPSAENEYVPCEQQVERVGQLENQFIERRTDVVKGTRRAGLVVEDIHSCASTI